MIKSICYRAKRKDMIYKILLHKSEEGYDVSCPGLPGCRSQGKTETEAIENIRCAIVEYIQAINDSLKDGEVREIEVSA
jgi:predicted RNase H-like HicB family nuclease